MKSKLTAILLVLVLICTSSAALAANFSRNAQFSFNLGGATPSVQVQPTSAPVQPTSVPTQQPSVNVPAGNVMKGGYSLFNGHYDKEEILSVTFLDTLSGAPSNAWDVSVNEDGSVMAWLESRGSYYDLYIAGNGGVRANPDSSYLFSSYKNMTKINFNNCFDTSGVTDMSSMFGSCEALESLDVSCFDTSSVEDFSSMFSSCELLTTIDVSGFDTSNATRMNTMFGFCSALQHVDVSGFNTSRVENMSYMFCWTPITALDVSNFDTSRVTDMSCMFSGCQQLSSLDLSGFSTASLTVAEDMFIYCDLLPHSTTSRFSSYQPTPAPTATPVPYYPYLDTSCEGPDVMLLQLRLIDLGYLPAGEADGDYGAKTASAVHRFKQSNYLSDYCSSESCCDADNAMQQKLFSSSALPWYEPDMALIIPSGESMGTWQKVSGDKMNFRMEVKNISQYRTVKAFEIYIYATDTWGDRIWGSNFIYYWTTEKNVKPGVETTSSYITLPDRSQIDELHAAIKKVRYTDGTVAEIPDYDLEYTNWVINW